MMISLIAAIGKNNELGKGNDLLWRLPNDQKHFRDTTLGHTVIMGRKTFESLGRPLPNRRNIVITRDENYQKEGADTAHSLDEAIDSARTLSAEAEEIFIIGGAEIYKQAMPIADRLYITHIEAEDKDADSFFPIINQSEWKEISHTAHKPDLQNVHGHILIKYEKQKD